MTTPPIIPLRLQRSRRKGSRLVSPNGLPILCMGRPSIWGNPFRADEFEIDIELSLKLYRQAVEGGWSPNLVVHLSDDQCSRVYAAHRAWIKKFIGAITCGSPLEYTTHFFKNHNLACWCGLCPKHANGKPLNEECRDCKPCHTDVIAAYLYPAPKRSRTVQFVHADGTAATSKTTNKEN